MYQGILHCLHSLGLGSVAHLYTQGLPTAPDRAIEELQYESAWRCLQWQPLSPMPEPRTTLSTDAPVGLHEALYRSLVAFAVGDARAFGSSIGTGRHAALKQLRHGAREPGGPAMLGHMTALQVCCPS